MKKLRVEIDAAPKRLRAGVNQIIARRPEMFTTSRGGVAVRFEPLADTSSPRLEVRFDKNIATISYARPIDAFRGLGRLMGGASHDFTETCAFDLLALLVDFSRNGVMRPEAAEDFLCMLALMGFNSFVPYMEDTYEVPGEQFFGYLRGGYSRRDLKNLDDFAYALGIEVSPCIQTLGHLEQLLQWPAYAHLRDVPGVLLAEEAKTYELLEKMLDAVMSPLRSKRIYAAMDETHGLGTGRYRAKFGAKSPFEILNAHMRKVVDLCNARGIRPMTSGDMYFRFGSKDNWYYDFDSVIPREVAEQIPPEMQLVYWDYYHTDAAFYEEWIERHRAIGKEPVISGGVWTWSHLWAHLPFSMATTDALMKASKAKGVRENVGCLWGDDGMECDVLSALPGLQYYADHSYGDSPPDQKITAANLRGSCGADLDAWMTASKIDQLPMLAEPREMPENCAKWLLWEDPMLGFLHPQLGRGVDRAAKHYVKLATQLTAASRRGGINTRLRFPAQIARVLSLKVGLHPRIASAVRAGNRRAIAAILRNELRALRREVDALWRLHRDLWFNLYKPFGWETIDGRYGRLRTRLQTLADRLTDFAAGRIDEIPELKQRLHKIFPKEDVYTLIDYARAATPSMIK
jgi:hexosaminidase